MARVISRRRNNLVAFGANRTFSEARLAACASVQAYAAGLDRGGPFLDLAIEESLEIIRRPAIGTNHGNADLLQPLLHRWGVQGCDGGGVEPLHDRRRRPLREEKPLQK